MFRGSSIHTIDDKGRIIIPSRFKDVIKASGRDAVMITRMDKSLFFYTLAEWNKIEERILSLADMSKNMRRIRRYFVGGAFECNCDKQGRVLIPPTLRDYAALVKEIVLVGLLDHFEIWSRENWDKENGQMEIDLQKGVVHEEIARLGL
ncbi:MAG: division/cell wall cluster transcriptional repressor MraZ [Desulfobacteraceae bacterium]|nr:division/cell wall cluster transcriptional repressor MraZ [Desulfobacteraceae bacterium]